MLVKTTTFLVTLDSVIDYFIWSLVDEFGKSFLDVDRHVGQLFDISLKHWLLNKLFKSTTFSVQN